MGFFFPEISPNQGQAVSKLGETILSYNHHSSGVLNSSNDLLGGSFIFLIFTPIWGNDPI